MSRDLIATTLELCKIPSVTGNEQAICDHVERWARGLSGLVTERVSHSLIVRPGAPRAGQKLVGLFGHLDTVLPSSDQPYEVRDGKLYGCGASDMKAGLAVMMALLEQRERYGCDIAGIFYEREEGPHAENGLELLLDRLPAMDLAVMLEPTANRLQLGCVGSLNARVTFRGKRAHSARPWQGDNAIYHSIAFLEKLRDWGRRELIIDGLPFSEVINATQASTANSHNVIPDAFVLNVNYRFAPGRDRDSACAVVRDLVGSAADIDIRDIAPSGQVCRQHPLIEAWLGRCPLPVEPKQAWTDVARMTEHGVPAVNFGPGEPAQAHQAGEWVETAALDEGLRLLEALLA
jgi:succinyl-diaminopimelate desuccinylase